ncbi:MAG: glycosyltransferase family 4 protein, partial [Promicromonosporaceae bacterium]|nr:glycosyltransferase family 4 protein [Promicromonosporaceae bacterium]
MRVGLLLDDSLDRPDGVQRCVLTLGSWLTGQGHEVHYLAPATERTDLPNLHVIGRTAKVRFNGNTLGTPLPLRPSRARALIASLDLDVLDVQLPYSPLLAGRVIDAAYRAQVPILGRFMIYPQSRAVALGARLLGLKERRRLRRLAQVVSLSEAAQEFARQAFGIGSEVIGAPVETQRFAAAQAPPANPECPSLLFLGRLEPRKGPRELLAALGELAQREPERPWTAHLAGRGPLLAELQAQAARLGLTERVTFPGFIADDDVPALLASADVVVLPSRGGESFGVSVVEALAAAQGVVLAGDNPGYRTVM